MVAPTSLEKLHSRKLRTGSRVPRLPVIGWEFDHQFKTMHVSVCMHLEADGQKDFHNLELALACSLLSPSCSLSLSLSLFIFPLACEAEPPREKRKN